MTENLTRSSDMMMFLIATASAAISASVWVALTLETGSTYHFFPLAITAFPGLAVSWLGTVRPTPGLVISLGAIGLLVTGAAWLLLELADSAPSATFVDVQPGGVRAEVVVLALAGALLGARFVYRSDGTAGQ